MLAIVYPIMLGLGRIETYHILKHNGVFQDLTGLPAYPDPTTLRRFLLRMAPLSLNKLRKLHDRLMLIMIQKPKLPLWIVFDLDSTVLVLCSRQEFVRIGYNPKKKGRPSYLKLKPLNVWKFYNGRAAVELIIKELKEDYPLAKIPTKHFAANEAYFHLFYLRTI